MPPSEHAVLSASSANRWLHCPPSVRLSEGYMDKASVFAMEGTSAHELCEYKLRSALGMEAENPTENLDFYNTEMEECAEGYATYILELVEKAKETCSDPVIMVEQRVDFSRYVPEGFGTADCIIIADDILNIVDYKHGKGVEVSAEDNPQMKLYALGALELFDCLYDISKVQMTIFQPRLSNVSVFVMNKADLLNWANDELTAKAELAFEGKGELCCGEWCKFCKAKSNCKERARVNMEMAQYEFRKSSLLTDEEVVDILSKVDELTSWASDVKNFALEQAVRGKQWPGWKVVEGRSNRKYTDESAVAQVVKNAGYNPYDEKIMGITNMTKMLGKEKFNELLGDFVERPQGKPTLVTEDDKRPEMNTAKEDFKEEIQL
nr:DUF2800 domain-containing protein [uncultured Ruminococcus sp.]